MNVGKYELMYVCGAFISMCGPNADVVFPLTPHPVNLVYSYARAATAAVSLRRCSTLIPDEYTFN